jgi:adenylylsulfate kinase
MSWAIWITGPPASGKSSIARAVEAELRGLGQPVKRLELDEVRETITPAPSYTDAEREVVYRALGCMAVLLIEAGRPVLIDATAHRRRWRDLVREAVSQFAEVQLLCPLEVDVPYELALDPELSIDTSAVGLGESAAQVVRLAGQLARQARAPAVSTEGARGPAWAIWITGRPGSGKSTLAVRVADALRERGTPLRLLDLALVERYLLGGRPTSGAEQDLVHRVLAYAAKLLTEAGVSVIVDATARRRAWREAARSLIPCFAEIQLLCPSAICLERERAVRWGLTFEARQPIAAPGPDIDLDYEESFHPDLVIHTDVHDVGVATQRVLVVVEQLAATATGRPAEGRPA